MVKNLAYSSRGGFCKFENEKNCISYMQMQAALLKCVNEIHFLIKAIGGVRVKKSMLGLFERSP